MSHWWVVVNPSAGSGKNIEARVRAALDRRGINHTLRVSHSPEALTSIIAEGRAEGHGRFVAVGGDGTANLVANGVLAHEWASTPTLAMLPAGSASDLARTFALPGDIEDASSHLVGHETQAIDVGLLAGSFGERYFLNAANAGIAARTVIEAERLPDRLGARRYVIAFWSALAKTAPADVHVDSDGRMIDGIAWNVVIANGRFFGGAMNVAPNAIIDDGLFDVQVFSGPRRSAPTVIRRVIRGTHLTHRAVRRTSGSEVAVGVPDDWIVEADGEIIGTGSFTAKALQGRLLFKT
ncbi:MAG: YegS/Rv2252/BmrU family lipid kinase [Actinomycetota bacterium]